MVDSDARRQPDRQLRPSQRVIAEIAQQNAVAPTDLPPLHDVIDPDALDALFEPTPDTGRMTGEVSFEYGGYDVIVYAHGYVDTTPIDQ